MTNKIRKQVERIVNNYVNGNLRDAKHLARRNAKRDIHEGLMIVLNYSERKARLTSDFLKGAGGWQEACDAV